MGYLRFIPVANLYYGDVQHAMKAGSEGLLAAEVFIESVKPYADLWDLRVKGVCRWHSRAED